MGNNSFGKLGLTNLEDTSYITTPKLIESLSSKEVTSISCGWNHSAAVTRDG